MERDAKKSMVIDPVIRSTVTGSKVKKVYNYKMYFNPVVTPTIKVSEVKRGKNFKLFQMEKCCHTYLKGSNVKISSY